MPHRVCLIIPTLDQGGAEKQLCLLAAGLDRSKFEPHVIALTRSGPLAATLEQANVPLHVIGKRGKLDPTASWRLTQKIRSLAPQLVHTWLFAANSYGRWGAHRAKVPVILAGERCVDPWKQWWNFAIDRFLLRYTQKIVTNSSGVRDFYAQHGIPPDKFCIISNGVPAMAGSAISREEALKRMGLPAHAKILGAIGRLWPQKGYKDILWGCELLRVVRDDTFVVILGDGPQRQRLEHYRDQIGIGARARFLGHRDDVRDLLPHFDLLWNASHYEGQSNSILEAMQAGVPVVATDIPGNRDLVVPGETGFLFPQSDSAALARFTLILLNQPEKRVQFGQQAKQRIATEFSLDRMIRNHEELYQSLIQKISSGEK